jgi:hypothetical protein
MVRPPSILTSQSVCEVSTPQRPHISPPLLQGDDLPTPGLAMSPPTRRTSLSQTPVTPINQSFRAHFSAFKSKESALENNEGPIRADREIDPTCLFVGGLEMFGPSAWTEEKVQAFFGRFGGLEYVRFVRPRKYLWSFKESTRSNACLANGSAAYAFVKYDNRESPAQAILEEVRQLLPR